MNGDGGEQAQDQAGDFWWVVCLLPAYDSRKSNCLSAEAIDDCGTIELDLI